MVPKKKVEKACELLDSGESQAQIAKTLHVSKSWVYKLNRSRKNTYGARIIQQQQTIQQFQPIQQPQQQPQPNQTAQEQTETNPFKLEPNYADVSIGTRGGISTSNKSKKTGYRYINRNLVYDFELQRHFMYSIISGEWEPLSF